LAEVRQVVFSHKEVVEALVRKQGLTEGIWGLYVEFGIGAANVGTSHEQPDLLPAAIVPIVKIGLQRYESENNLAVDAATLTSAPGSAGARKKSKATKRQSRDK